MEFKSQATNRPQNPQPANAGQQAGGNVMNTMRQPGKHGQKKLIMCVVIIVIIAALVAGFLFMKKGSQFADVKKNQYQAVFLTNGQVYFGKIAGGDEKVVKLTDIYYLQVQQNVQPAEENKDESDKSQISMAKLGDELHGPEDTMFIQRDQVLFWENLKDSGKVVQAIKSNKK